VPYVGGRLAYARFEAPDRPLYAPRFRAGPVGGESDELDAFPGAAVPFDEAVLPGQQHANEDFYGIRSRSRFYSPLYNPPVGHGAATSGVQAGPIFTDPARGRSQFDDRFVEPHRRGLSASSMTEFPMRTEYASSLGQEDVTLAREGVLRFARPDYGPAPVGAQPIIGPPSWYAAGPIPPSLRASRRGTLRREFMQWAQTFLGRHAIAERRGMGSTSPVRMRPAHTNRLTRRDLPASFGSTTEVLGA
jgi:hypothetical protein